MSYISLYLAYYTWRYVRVMPAVVMWDIGYLYIKNTVCFCRRVSLCFANLFLDISTTSNILFLREIMQYMQLHLTSNTIHACTYMHMCDYGDDNDDTISRLFNYHNACMRTYLTYYNCLWWLQQCVCTTSTAWRAEKTSRCQI